MGTIAVADQLTWERAERPRTAIAAVLGGVLLLAGSAADIVAANNAPAASLHDALVHSQVFNENAPAAIDKAPSILTPVLAYLHDHAVLFVVAVVLTALGSLATGYGLAGLFRYARYRRPETSQVALIAAIGGAVAYGVGFLVQQIVTLQKAGDFVASNDHTVGAAKDTLSASLGVAGSIVHEIGSLALALGLILVSINALRVGLLTRFMGILGVLAGVLFVLPIVPVPVLQALWLFGVAVLALGRWPNGQPPAWERGEAVPWPTQQEIREQRERQAPRGQQRQRQSSSGNGTPDAKSAIAGAVAALKGSRAAPEPPAEPAKPAASQPHPATSKRKRKKRR